MKDNMPRTPFSTALSGSARVTEMRLRNIFSGPRKRPPAPFLALVFSICIFCGNLVSCNVAEAEPDAPPPAEVWLDYYGSPELFQKDDAEIELPEYPGVTFRWTKYRVSAVVDGRETELFTGMPVESVYLCDITGDGLRELCAVTAFGSGMIDERISAYDYAAGEMYLLQSRGMFDYGLSLEDGQLQVTRYRYPGGPQRGQPLSVGRLAIEEGTVLLEGEAQYKALRLADEVPILTDDPDLAYLLMREHENYPYSAEHMFAQLLLSQESEDCTLALAKVIGGHHPEGLGSLMLGLWDRSARNWRGPVYTVGGDDGLYSSWTADDGSLHILCANTVTWTGEESFCGAAHYRFDGQTLEEVKRWEADSLEEDVKLVPAQGGMEIYARNPQYLLQYQNPEYNGVELPDVWVYDRFAPVSE